jgi:hypothetical protein
MCDSLFIERSYRMKKQGRPATGRVRSKKLHIWILPKVDEILHECCCRTGLDKVDVIEHAIDNYYIAEVNGWRNLLKETV